MFCLSLNVSHLFSLNIFILILSIFIDNLGSSDFEKKNEIILHVTKFHSFSYTLNLLVYPLNNGIHANLSKQGNNNKAQSLVFIKCWLYMHFFWYIKDLGQELLLGRSNKVEMWHWLEEEVSPNYLNLNRKNILFSTMKARVIKLSLHHFFPFGKIFQDYFICKFWAM